MKKLNYFLRSVNMDDLDLIYEWRNRPEVRAFMFSSSEIPKEEHDRWFAAMLQDKSKRWFVLNAHGLECAVIYFSEINGDRSCSWGFYSGPVAPSSVSLLIEMAALEYAFEQLLVHRLQCQVLSGNRQVINLHEKAGFLQEGRLRQARETPRGIEDVIVFGMLSNEWPAARDRLQIRATELPPLMSQAYENGFKFVTILSDASSWLNQYLDDLQDQLETRRYCIRWIHDPDHLLPGDVCLLLSCGRLLSAEQLSLHRHNLVVHESALPLGKGWSPMTWQILEGASSIPITLFEASAELDAGPIFLQQNIALQGHELVEEWRALQAQATLGLCLAWFDRYLEVLAAAQPQRGEASFYRRRRSADSQLDLDRSLAEQFNLLRVVDNQRYPAFFDWRGRRYVLHVQMKLPEAHQSREDDISKLRAMHGP
jgi:methionyl-tRNA formyltransferase